MLRENLKINLTAVNGCAHVNECGFVKFLKAKGLVSNELVNCGKKRAEECARHPENPLSWVELDLQSAKTREELDVVFPKVK